MKSTLEMMAELPFERGDIVYHVTAKEKEAGLLTYIKFTPDEIVFGVVWPGRCETGHYACELSKEYVPKVEIDLKNGEEA